eukprot:CAMPEP_0194540524 /NCGR_PEP_ID=MMETSP0253-20130528/80761_1 /TAXON_ID=2966 /ORGANISM="Noctiluca scintillans" /LENGTH=65 /DNA_ID=CAMNT_0039386901 /DNA_START=213 /DNA_END=406 /DNA_ORIENTATION=+
MLQFLFAAVCVRATAAHAAATKFVYDDAVVPRVCEGLFTGMRDQMHHALNTSANDVAARSFSEVP